MRAHLSRLEVGLNVGYRVAVGDIHIGDVFKTEHPYFPSIALWYGYLPGQDFPLDPEIRRGDVVETFLAEYRKSLDTPTAPR